MAESIVQNSHFLLGSDIDISDYCDYFEYSGHHTFSTTIGFYCREVLLLDIASLLEIPYSNYRGGKPVMLGYTFENMHAVYTETQSGKMPYYWLIQFWCEDYGNMSNWSETGTGTNYASRFAIDTNQTMEESKLKLTSFGRKGNVNAGNASHCQLYVDFETSNWNDPNPQYYRVDAEFDFTAIALIP